MRVIFPPKLEFLSEPHRYKVLYGGRGGIKSWSIAQHLLIAGVQRPLRIPCARETMQSIRESVHQLRAMVNPALSVLEYAMEQKEKDIRGALAAAKEVLDRAKPEDGDIDIWLPRKLRFLREPHRYKVLYGGRGGIKSWSIAQSLLIEGGKRTLRIPCARETMMSIKASVHQLLEDQISRLGLQAHYTVQKAEIIGRNGTSFTFHGLRDKSVHNIKSLEGANILWVEEAQNVSKNGISRFVA